MANAYTSRVLYHLVGSKEPTNHEKNLATLRAVLTSMELRTNTVSGHSGGIHFRIDPNRACVDGEPIEQTIICFCDIPFESLGLHTLKYGEFGVGVDRDQVAKWGGRPVIYIPTTTDVGAGINNYFSQEVMNAWKGLHDHFPERATQTSRYAGSPPRNADEAIGLAQTVLSHLLAFTKMFDVDLPDNDIRNYYMEREWRKPAKLSLQLPLKEIIAPERYHTLLRSEFPRLSHVPLRSPPTRRN